MPLSKRKKREDFLMECSNAKIQIAVKSMMEVMDLEGFALMNVDDTILQ